MKMEDSIEQHLRTVPSRNEDRALRLFVLLAVELPFGKFEGKTIADTPVAYLAKQAVLWRDTSPLLADRVLRCFRLADDLLGAYGQQLIDTTDWRPFISLIGEVCVKHIERYYERSRLLEPISAPSQSA